MNGLTLEEVINMEIKLHRAISPAFFGPDIKEEDETPNDREVYKAFSAVQDLRRYMEKQQQEKEKSQQVQAVSHKN
ncbi:MAG: hypothetical protein NC434_10895 [Ruminococcus sp.]|nr:hypothetical protein [Ruminococcus sp.]